MVDLAQIQAEATAEVQKAVNELVVEKLQARKGELLGLLETVKADLNEVDGHINSLVPPVEEPVQEEAEPLS